MIYSGNIQHLYKWRTQHSRATKRWIYTPEVTCYFSRFPLFNSRGSLPAHCSRGLLSQCLISFLVSFPNKKPQEETVFTELSTAVGVLWSLKAAETHVWYFYLDLDWTFQVHVKGTKPNRAKQKHTHKYDSPNAPIFKQTDLHRPWKKWKTDLLFQ